MESNHHGMFLGINSIFLALISFGYGLYRVSSTNRSSLTTLELYFICRKLYSFKRHLKSYLIDQLINN